MKKRILFVMLFAVTVILASCTQTAPDQTESAQPVSSVTTEIKNEIDIQLKETKHETPQEDIHVTEALSYTKIPVPVVDLPLDFINEVHIPALTGSTANIAAFNQKIYDKYVVIYNELVNGLEENRLYKVEYLGYRHGNVVSILISCTYGVQFSEFTRLHEVLYYDVASDCETDFSVALQAGGITKDTFDNKARNSEDFRSYCESFLMLEGIPFNGRLIGGVFSDDYFYALYENDVRDFYNKNVLIEGKW